MLQLWISFCTIGNGLAKQRKTILEEAIDEGLPFARIHKGIRKTIEDGLDMLKSVLLNDVKAVFDNMLRDLTRCSSLRSSLAHCVTYYGSK